MTPPIERFRAALAVCAVALATNGRMAHADTLDARDRLGPIRKHAVGAPLVAGKHRLYGEIRAIRGVEIAVRLRSGHVVDVDAAPAIASGRYSAPLFVGKYVVIDARADLAGRMHAQTITRLSALSGITEDDR